MTTRWMNVNLLSPEPVTKRYSFVLFLLAFGILALSTASLSVLLWSTSQSNKNVATLLNQVTAEQRSQTEELHTLQTKVHTLQAVRQAVNNSGQAVDAKQLLDSIISTAGSGISIQSINYKPGNIDLVGSTANYGNIAQFEDALQHLPSVSSVWLSSVNSTSNQCSFTVSIVLKGAMGP